jgi:hypothetical protein
MPSTAGQHPDQLTKLDITVAGTSGNLMDQMTPVEVILTESLLTPGLQTSVKVHSYFHNLPIKNLNEFQGSRIHINIDRPSLARYALPTTFDVDNVIYRLSDRKLINENTEEFILHACHRTLLDDAATLVSKMWKCTTPSAITSEVLRSCAGAGQLDIEGSSPARDYAAENIHPFQVVQQQAAAALAGGNDPSFIHFMTYRNLGTHHFRSLQSLSKGSPQMVYFYEENGAAGGGYGNPFGIMSHSFPCDFDLLSDILNGIDENGNDINTLLTFNPLMRMVNQFGSKTLGCGLGSGNPKISASSAGSEMQQNMCPDYSQTYIQKRQARMGLLEQDKIALRLIVPWVSHIHAGDIIRLELRNRKDSNFLNYGSGDYMIHSITHNIKYRGFSTLTIDCVAETVGRGIV